MRRVGPWLVVLVGLATLHPLWSEPGIVHSIHSDIIAEHIGIKAVGQAAFGEEGRVPLWNPAMNAGAPALANPQSMYFFPLDALYALLPLDRATNLVILLNFLLAGLGMYLFSRRLFEPAGAALFAAIAYMLSYRYLAMIHAGWLPKMSMYALVPLVFWAGRRVLREPGGAATAWLAGVVALALLQGDMQQLYYAALGGGVFALWSLRELPAKVRLRACAHLGLAALLGAMLAAPLLLPRLEFVLLSSRSTPSYEFFLSGAPTLASLSSFFDPQDQGGARHEFWENCFYFGIWLLPLWCLALWRETRRWIPAAIGLIGMCVLCFDSPLLKLCFDFVPGFDLFRKTPRILLLGQFVAVLLAGAGVEALLHWLRSRPPAFATIAVALLCGLPIADAILRAASRIETREMSAAFPAHPFQADLHRQSTTGRVLAMSRRTLPYGMAGYYGIDLVNGYASLTLRHYIEYFSILQGGSKAAIPARPVVWTDLRGLARPEMLHALDVRYVLANRPMALEAAGFERTARYDAVPVFVFYLGVTRVPIEVWRSERALGPAFFASEIRPVANEADSLEALLDTRSPTRANVMGLDRDVSASTLHGGSAELVKRGLNRYEYRITSEGTGFLILSQVWYPGWRATLAGKSVPLFRTNHALLGCFVPPGRHVLVLEMTQPWLLRGAALSGIACLLLVALVRAGRRVQ